MLTKLLERFDSEQFRVRESPSEPFEHEHEHEDDLSASKAVFGKILASLAATCAQRATSFIAELARAVPLQPR